MQIYESKADQEKFLQWAGDELYNRFLKQKQRLSGQETDMYYWMKKTPEDLDTRLSELENTPTRSQKSSTASEGARIVYKDDNWTIRQIDTYEAAVKYGKNTQWCITGCELWGKENGKKYFDEYFYNDDVRFLFFESKEPIDGMHKWAIASREQGAYEIYNEVDNRVDEIPDLPNINSLVTTRNYDYVYDKRGVSYIVLDSSTLLYNCKYVNRCFKKYFSDESSTEYSESDIKQYLESGQFAKDANIGIDYENIFLLSVYEARQLPKEVLSYEQYGWWWLRTPGAKAYSASYVSRMGSVRFGGKDVDNDYGGVRPAFKVSSSVMASLGNDDDYIVAQVLTPENVIKR